MNDTTAGERRRITLIGAPVDEGAGQSGCLMGPDALRVVGLADSLRDLGYEVADVGNLAPERVSLDRAAGGRARHAEIIAGWTRAIARQVYDTLAAGAIPLVMGGDHSLAMGSVAGVARYWQGRDRPLFILWLDAHADFNTPFTTPSGNMHGMPIAALTGEAELGWLFGPDGFTPLDPARFHLFGIRSIDREERDLLVARGVGVIDMRRVDEFGVSVMIREVIEAVASQDGVLHVSLDVDFLDPAVAPGVGTTVPGGATWREAHLIMEMLHDSGLVGSFDIVELNPILDERGRSARAMAELAASLFGRQIIARPTRPHW